MNRLRHRLRGGPLVEFFRLRTHTNRRRRNAQVAAVSVALLALGTLLSCDFFVDPGTLVSIAISPSNPTIALNNSSNQKNSQQFTATGTFGDLSTKDLTSTSTWASSAP